MDRRDRSPERSLWEPDAVRTCLIRLTTLGTEVRYLVSDRAKALIKLAHTGLGCLSIPDLFHLSHDLAKSYSLAIFGRLRHAKRDLEHAQQRLETLQQNAQAKRVHI